MLSQNQLAVIKASNLFLTTPFPDNYHELSDTELDACITENITEAFENFPLDSIYNLIYEAAVLLSEFHHSELGKFVHANHINPAFYVGVDMASGSDQSVTHTIGSNNNEQD